MYVKLALSNARKSVKDYLIYFITLTICVSLFYGLTSLSSSECDIITEDTFNFEALKLILKYATYLVTALLIILIAYVNKYMLKRRQKEFGTCILLGVEQKNVALMFFIENLIMGIISIFVGIIIGTLFSQLVLAIVFITAEQEIIFNFKIYMDTVLITLVFFMTIFCIIGLINVKTLKKSKLIDMLNSERKTEFQFKRKPIFYKLMFVLSIILYSISAFSIYKVIIEKNNIENFINLNLYLVIMLICFVLGTYAFYCSFSYLIIAIKEKCINFKYEYTNLFLISSITSKIKTAPVLMSTIAITFLGAALSFGVILLMSQWSLGYLDMRIPYDIIIRDDYLGSKDIKSIPKIDYSKFKNKLNKIGYDTKDYVEVKKYFINDSDFEIKDIKKLPVLAISLSDYNKLRSMLGYSKVELDNNEFTLQVDSASKDKEGAYAENNKSILIKDTELSIDEIPCYDETVGTYIYNDYYNNVVTFILPDEICESLSLAGIDFYANTKKKLSFEDTIEVEDYFYDVLNDSYMKEKGEGFNAEIRIKIKEKNNILNTTIGMRILGIYLGCVLLMITLTILSLQQLSDSIEHKGRFNTLRRLGIDEKEINKLVLKQIGIYFTMPLFIALIGFGLFMYSFVVMYEEVLNAYVGDKAIMLNIFIGITLMLLIYTGYFISTYFTFKRNIKY